MRITLKYGKGEQSADLPEQARFLRPRPSAPAGEAQSIITAALQDPIGTPRLRDIVKAGETVAVIVSDITRPVPSRLFLPQLLAELNAGGVKDEDIFIVCALGSHRGHSEEEQRYLVGDEVFDRVCVMDSDADDCLRLGVCAHGTPADIFRPVVEADRLICTGNVEYHYFAGYSGGAKALLPGVSSLEAIRANHSHMVKPECCAGKLEGNLVREDIEEAAQYRPIDFIFNVLLDEKKNITAAFAGHYQQAHRAACRALDAKYQTPICAKADIVIAGAGGYPKDINIYQAHKALENAQYAVADGGVIIWCAAADEGFGNAVMEDWMRHKDPRQMLADISERFVLGGHKAAAIANICNKARIIMVTELPRDTVEGMGFIYGADLQSAVDQALAMAGPSASILVSPFCGSTLPSLRPAMKIRLELDTSLALLIPGAQNKMEIETPQGALVAEVLDQLGLDQDAVEIALLDNKPTHGGGELYPGAVLSLFPLFGGG